MTDGELVITRRSMGKTVKPVTVTTPTGKTLNLTLENGGPGMWRSASKVSELGLYRATDGTLTAVTAAGPLNPKEVADMRATDTILKPVAEATGGGTHWLVDGIPQIRRVVPGQAANGSDWIGIRRNGAYRVTSLTQQPLLPAWVALMLIVGSLLLAWRIEGR